MHQDYRRNKSLKRILLCIDRALAEKGGKPTVLQKRTSDDQMER